MGEAILRFPQWAKWRLNWRAGRSRKRAATEEWPALDKRHAVRLPVTMHVQIYGRLGDAPFSENSETIDVCTLGSLVPISAHVRRSQRLILTNLQTNEELTCRVARFAKSEDGTTLVGLAFLQPGPRFWRSGPLVDPNSFG